MVISKELNDSIEITVEKLRNKEVVIIPTDTVYGFSGIVPWTEDYIRQIKGREENKPFIQLIAHPKDIYYYTDEKIDKKFLSMWPGPLTIIVPQKEDKTKTIALRCPNDAWLRKIIELTGFSIYSTSVNHSGKKILSDIYDIVKEFDKDVALIVDDGNKRESKASTIISIINGEVKLIRQGELQIQL
ncbi:MAG: L-threonylcarbamoyladenylate synthase [Spirochaetaceae bacterium]|nr:L-threonylcarbamoyladenylate synthase [Spirochaetaceae bacterium]